MMNRQMQARLRIGTALAAMLTVLAACGTAATTPSTTVTTGAPTVAAAVAVTGAPDLTAVQTQTPAGTTAMTSTGKLKVVATFSVISDLLQNVGGDKVDIVTLVGPDGDTHDFEPVPSDAAKLADAAILFENGLAFEAWLDNLYTSSSSRAERVGVSKGVQARAADPHVWQNVRNATQMVANIRDGLVKVDAANAEVYTANAEAYMAKLDALDREVEGIVAELPGDERRLVTSHDALGYFADRYGFAVIGEVIASLSTEAGEPSAQDIVALVANIKKQGVKAIFLENISNPALVERVAQEAGVKVGPELYTDALGKPGSAGATYLDAMRYNARAIVDALK